MDSAARVKRSATVLRTGSLAQLVLRFLHAGRQHDVHMPAVR